MPIIPPKEDDKHPQEIREQDNQAGRRTTRERIILALDNLGDWATANKIANNIPQSRSPSTQQISNTLRTHTYVDVDKTQSPHRYRIKPQEDTT